MKSKVWESLAVILLASPLSAVAGDITYDVEQAVGTGSVVGTITTDGTIGVLSSADVVAWDLTLRAPNLSGGTQVLTQSNGTFSDTGGFGATASHLVFNYGGTTGQLFIFEGGSHSDYWCGAASGGDACNLESDPAETIGYSSVTGGNAEDVSEAGAGLTVLATAVPAPTTLATLIAGLLVLATVRRQRPLFPRVKGRTLSRLPV